MSLTSIALSDRGRTKVGGPPPAPDTRAHPAADFADKVTKFIPGDVLTIFLSGIAAIHGAFLNISTSCVGGAVQSAATSIVSMPLAGVLSASNATGAQEVSTRLFWACIVFIPVYSIGLRYIASPNGEAFIWPIWGMLAGLIAFWIYASMIGDVLFGCPTIVTTLVIIFTSPLLALVNEIVAKRFPKQAI